MSSSVLFDIDRHVGPGQEFSLLLADSFLCHKLFFVKSLCQFCHRLKSLVIVLVMSKLL